MFVSEGSLLVRHNFGRKLISAFIGKILLRNCTKISRNVWPILHSNKLGLIKFLNLLPIHLIWFTFLTPNTLKIDPYFLLKIKHKSFVKILCLIRVYTLIRILFALKTVFPIKNL